MPTRLLLTRHGETTANAAHRFSGHSDVALTALGRRQARALARRLRGETIDAAYASDLCRARDTARIALGGRDITVFDEPGLREFNFGDWEGRTFQEVREGWPDDWSRLLAIDDGFCAPGGEPLRETRARVAGAVQRIVAAHRNETVLIAAHGGTLQLIFAEVLGMGAGAMFRIATDNCGLSIVEVHGERPLVRLVNDQMHLKRFASPRAPTLQGARV